MARPINLTSSPADYMSESVLGAPSDDPRPWELPYQHFKSLTAPSKPELGSGLSGGDIKSSVIGSLAGAAILAGVTIYGFQTWESILGFRVCRSGAFV